MGTVSRVHTFASGAILTAAQLNNEFDNLLTSSAINGGLDATNLGVTAGQATASKALVVDASRNLADATGSNRINNLALSGTFESTGAVTASAGITSGGNIVSDTDSTDDLGTTGVRWANLFVDDVTVTNNVTIGGTLTLTGGITLNGNTTIGDSSADTLTVNSTITSNLIFTDATYDIGASGATRPRDLFLSRNAVMGGTLGVTGATTLSSTLGVTGLITATGGVSGALTGNVTGNVTGDLTGNVTGNVTGNLTGDVTGNISGNVTGGTISGTTGTFSGAVNANNLVLDASNSYPILFENQAGTTADAAISTYDDANGTLLSLGSNYYYTTGGAEARFNTSEEAAGIVLNRTGIISLRTSDGSNNTIERISIGNTGDVAVNTSQLFVDQSASRVGINTASPQGTVHAHLATDKNIRLQVLGAYAGIGALNDDSSSYIQMNLEASDLVVGQYSGGNMGLGVTPSAWSGRRALEIEGASTGYVTSPNGPIAIGSNIYYNGGDKFVGNGYAPLYALSSGNHIWYTSNNNTSGAGAAVTLTQAMTLTNAGLLGLGTVSPTSGFKLDIADAADGANIKLRTTGTSNAAKQIHFEGYRPNGTAAVISRLETINKNGSVTLSRIDTNTESVYNSGAITFSTASTGTLAERARITSDGKLCLNRTSGSTALSIDPHATGQPNIQLYNKTNDAYTYLKNDGSAFVIQNSYGTTAGFKPIQFMANGSVNLHIDEVGGSVGIGTASPQGPLTVKPATNENLNIVGGSGDLRLSALNDAQSATVQLSIQADPLYIRGTGGVIKSAFLGNGNVGIGTSSPEAPLEVIADSSQGYAVFLEAAASGTEGAALRGKGTYSIADAGTQTFTVGNGAIVMISENNTGDGAMFFCGFKSATVTLVADPNSRYANTVTAGKISLTKSASSSTVTLTNNSGSTKSFTILKIICSD